MLQKKKLIYLSFLIFVFVIGISNLQNAKAEIIPIQSPQVSIIYPLSTENVSGSIVEFTWEYESTVSSVLPYIKSFSLIAPNNTVILHLENNLTISQLPTSKNYNFVENNYTKDDDNVYLTFKFEIIYFSSVNDTDINGFSNEQNYTEEFVVHWIGLSPTPTPVVKVVPEWKSNLINFWNNNYIYILILIGLVVITIICLSIYNDYKYNTNCLPYKKDGSINPQYDISIVDDLKICKSKGGARRPKKDDPRWKELENDDPIMKLLQSQMGLSDKKDNNKSIDEKIEEREV